MVFRINFAVTLLAIFCCTLKIGSADVKPRIVGGQPVIKNELNYQVSIRRNGRHICGGAIIAERDVLTAAHCVQIGEISEFEVVAGDHSLSKDDGTEQVRNVSGIIFHPEYDAWTVFNDIAILQVTTPLTMNRAVMSIPLAPEGHDAAGVGLVSGWGIIENESEKLSDILQKLGVPLVSDKVCRESYDPMDIADSMICAGFPSGGIDVCKGDAGAPLVCYDNPEPYVCGIFSWQHTNCGEPKFYSVYTEVAYYTDWIARNLI